MKSSKFSYKKEILKYVGLMILMPIIIIAGIYKDSIDKKIYQNTSFLHVTSIAGIDNNADVYKTRMSVPKAAKYIMYLEEPLDNTNLNDQNHIQFFYEYECISIYKGEDGETLVQVSSRAYVHGNGYSGMYRPYNKDTKNFYDKTYMSSKFYKEDIKNYGKIND